MNESFTLFKTPMEEMLSGSSPLRFKLYRKVEKKTIKVDIWDYLSKHVKPCFVLGYTVREEDNYLSITPTFAFDVGTGGENLDVANITWEVETFQSIGIDFVRIKSIQVHYLEGANHPKIRLKLLF